MRLATECGGVWNWFVGAGVSTSTSTPRGSSSNGLTIAHSLPRAADTNRLLWTTFDLTTANLGNYEPVIDNERWVRDNVMDILYQPSSGLGYTPPANTASQIGVLEWDAATYFAHQPAEQLTFANAGHDAVISFP